MHRPPRTLLHGDNRGLYDGKDSSYTAVLSSKALAEGFAPAPGTDTAERCSSWPPRTPYRPLVSHAVSFPSSSYASSGAPNDRDCVAQPKLGYPSDSPALSHKIWGCRRGLTEAPQ